MSAYLIFLKRYRVFQQKCFEMLCFLIITCINYILSLNFFQTILSHYFLKK
jgi:hypothetical protein